MKVINMTNETTAADTLATETVTTATTTTPPMHPAAVELCAALDVIAEDALYGDIRKATATLASEFAKYLRTPD